MMILVKEARVVKVVFNNGVELNVGDELEDGNIVFIEEEEDVKVGERVVRFLVAGNGEGWNVYMNEDGEEVDEDGW
jgi:hypothetical protein